MKIVIAMPVYDTIEFECSRSLNNELRNCKCKTASIFMPGCSVIEKSRNTLSKMFLEKFKGFTHLIFIDSDIIWDASAGYLKKMVSRNKDILCGIYAMKQENMRPAIRTLNVQKWIDAGAKGDKPREYVPKDSVFEISHGGTGWMMIKRECLERIYEKYPYPFMNVIDKGYYQHDDFAFCTRAKELGYKIWADSSIKLGHVGKGIYWVDEIYSKEPKP